MEDKRNIENLKNTKSIILFDGLCNLCDSSVQFVLKRDKKNNFLFSSLQSSSAREFLSNQSKEIQQADSILLVTHDKVYLKSTAALKIAQSLSGLWFLTSVFFILPKNLRDWIYDGIAKKRYQWFGKFDVCKIPSDEEKNKFID